MDDETPVSPTDLLSLPSSQRRVMSLMLRNKEMTISALQAAVDALPEGERMPPDVLDTCLEALVGRKWLVRLEQAQTVSYRVGGISRSGALNKEPDAQVQRKKGVTDRLNIFWESVDADIAAQQQEANRKKANRGSVLDDLLGKGDKPEEPKE